MRRITLTSYLSGLAGRALLLAALLCGSAQADGFSAEALIEKSGLGTQLDVMPRSMKIGFGHALKQGTLRLSAEQIRDIHVVFDRAYAPQKLRAMMVERIPARIDAQTGERIIAFLDSPLGKRIVEKEAQLAQPKIQSEIQENAAKIVADIGANSSRLALYAALDRAMESTQRGVAAYIGSALASAAAVVAKMPDSPQRPTLEQIRKNLDGQRLAISAAMSQAVLSNFAYAYKDLSEEDLNAYLQFALSPDGIAYSRGVGDLFAEVLVECAADVGRLSAAQRQGPI